MAYSCVRCRDSYCDALVQCLQHFYPHAFACTLRRETSDKPHLLIISFSHVQACPQACNRRPPPASSPGREVAWPMAQPTRLAGVQPPGLSRLPQLPQQPCSGGHAPPLCRHRQAGLNPHLQRRYRPLGAQAQPHGPAQHRHRACAEGQGQAALQQQGGRPAACMHRLQGRRCCSQAKWAAQAARALTSLSSRRSMRAARK